ncbi:MAG: hypothetical protein A2107_00785 [Verrucomicrobia bacterium GWF2_62_7]|nr:MAG: hypothetical protein A2107_00785 [Verrucomicrobia bacterium GWF2_62_7]
MNIFTCLFAPVLAAIAIFATNLGMAAEPLAQTNAPSVSKAPVPPTPKSNIVVVAKPVVQINAPTMSVTQRLPASIPVIAAASTQIVQTNTLTVGEARLLAASGSNIVVPVEDVVRVIPAGPGKVVVSAEQEGHTDMMVLDDDSKITEHYALIVIKKQHEAEKLTYEGSLEDFRQVVKKMVGDHEVSFDMLVGPRISFNGTNLVSTPHPVLFIHGEAKDEIEADTIRNVASRFYGQGNFGSTSQQVTPTASVNPNGATSTNTVQVTNLNNDPNIVDQMTVRTHHQIRIRVQVAEVNVTAAKSKGIKYSDALTYGVGQSPMDLNNIDLKPSTIMGMVPTAAALPFGGVGAQKVAFQATLQLLINDGYARLLSEPTLVTKSGQEASFLAGGQLLQELTGQGVATTQLIPFGVSMTIKPTVDRANHIDAEVRTEVSDVPATIQSAGAIGILTRNSTVKLRLNNRDTLILGGLLQNNFRNSIRKLPWLGQVPILGALFRSKDWNSGQTELLFFVTPEIIGEDLKADTEHTIATPVMKQWHNVDSHKDVLSDPNSHAGPDNDVHDLLGLPTDRMHNDAPKQAPVVPDTAPMRGASQ